MSHFANPSPSPRMAYHGRHSAGILEHALTVAEFKAWEKLKVSRHDRKTIFSFPEKGSISPFLQMTPWFFL